MFSFLRRTSLYLLAIPLLTFGIGAASNQLVLSVNQDRFPVMWNDYKIARHEKTLEKAAQKTDKKGKPTEEAEQAQLDLMAFEAEGFIDSVHVVMTHKTRLNYLSDIFDLQESTYSIGDALLSLGEWLTGFMMPVWIFDVVRKLNKKNL